MFYTWQILYLLSLSLSLCTYTEFLFNGCVTIICACIIVLCGHLILLARGEGRNLEWKGILQTTCTWSLASLKTHKYENKTLKKLTCQPKRNLIELHMFYSEYVFTYTNKNKQTTTCILYVVYMYVCRVLARKKIKRVVDQSMFAVLTHSLDHIKQNLP